MFRIVSDFYLFGGICVYVDSVAPTCRFLHCRFLHPWLELETWIQFLHIPFLFVQFILADPSPAPISHSCEIANYTGSIGTSVAQTVSVFAEPEFGSSTNANDLSAVLTQVDEAIADVTNTINGFNTDAISGYFTNTCAYRMMSPSMLNI